MSFTPTVLASKSVSSLPFRRRGREESEERSDEDAIWSKRLELIKKNPLIAGQVELLLAIQEKADSRQCFPNNVTEWLGKVTWVQQNEDKVGPRWLIHWSKFIKSVSLCDENGNVRIYPTGFNFLQEKDIVNNAKLYPFAEFRRLMSENHNSYNIEQIDHLVQIWSKMILYLITGGGKRHPWFYTQALHEFCCMAASSLPKLSELYTDIHSGLKDIKKLGDDKVKEDILLNALRQKIPHNKETLANETSLGGVIYEKICKHLEVTKQWWPVQLQIKVNRSALTAEQIAQTIVPSVDVFRNKKAKRTSAPMTEDSQVWIERDPKLKYCPSEMKQFYDNFYKDGYDVQHSELWQDWLTTQE